MVGLGAQGDIMTSAMVVDHTPPVTTATLSPESATAGTRRRR